MHSKYKARGVSLTPSGPSVNNLSLVAQRPSIISLESWSGIHSLTWQLVSTITGQRLELDTVRHNKRLVPRFHPEWNIGLVDEDSETDLPELIEEISQNLTSMERRTWLRLLDGRSVVDIAEEDGVSRAAVYARIRGKRTRDGGMIAKNDYVAIWWRRRQAEEKGHGR